MIVSDDPDEEKLDSSCFQGDWQQDSDDDIILEPITYLVCCDIIQFTLLSI